MEKLSVINVGVFLPDEVFSTSMLTNGCIVGKTLAFTSVRFIDKDDKVVARGSHTKFVALAQKDEKNIIDELQPVENESKASSALGASDSAR